MVTWGLGILTKAKACKEAQLSLTTVLGAVLGAVLVSLGFQTRDLFCSMCFGPIHLCFSSFCFCFLVFFSDPRLTNLAGHLVGSPLKVNTCSLLFPSEASKGKPVLVLICLMFVSFLRATLLD